MVVLEELAADYYPGIEPASHPTARYFEQHAEKYILRGQMFRAVGYGMHEPGPGGQRMLSVSDFRSVTGPWLRLSQNNHTIDGGTCFGDSGSPIFLDAKETGVPEPVCVV